jgi:tripartite-type tricarboxylate transporter receptor subunit TctC
MRLFTVLGAIAVAVQMQSSAAASPPGYPSRSVTIVVPFAPGGAVDVLARFMAEALTPIIGQTVVVENISGAGGTIGISRVARSAPDGYQVALGGVGTLAFSQSLYIRPLYDSRIDLVPVGLITEEPLLLVTRTDLPAADLREFIAYSKSGDTRLRFGSAGAGSGTHLGCAMLNAFTGLNATHVPYRGAAPAMQDLVAGRIDYMCNNVSVMLPHFGGNTVKVIANLGRYRSAMLQNVPTAHEQGLSEFDAAIWNGFFLPKGTSVSIAHRLHQATFAALETSSLRRRLQDIGLTIVAPERRSPSYLGGFLAAEIEKWAKIVNALGIKID